MGFDLADMVFNGAAATGVTQVLDLVIDPAGPVVILGQPLIDELHVRGQRFP
jgi:hypothetical protein